MSGNNNLEQLCKEDEQSFLARVKGNLEKLEIIRQEKLKNYKFRRIIGWFTAVIIIVNSDYLDLFLKNSHLSEDHHNILLPTIILAMIYAWVTHPKRQYAKLYKKEILPELAASMGLTYKPDGRIPMSEMEPSNIVPPHHKYKSRDYLEGSYKNVSIKFANITLKKNRGTKWLFLYRVTPFKGKAILLEMKHKKFYGNTILIPNEGRLSEWARTKITGMKRAKILDQIFEKNFDAYTTDQTEAHYLVEPSVIRELKKLLAQYEGYRIFVGYYPKHVLIMIDTQDKKFESTDIHLSATEPESSRAMRNDIKQILSFIDRLHLYDPYAFTSEQENMNNHAGHATQ